MRISTDIAWLLTTALVALRLGVALLVTPLLAFGGVPARFRAILVLSLAALLVSATGARPAGEVHDVAAFAGMAASETVLGALLAFGVLAAFAAFQLAGRLLDLQLGFGVATLIDPATRGHAPLLGTLLWMAAVALFFATDGHHALLRAFALSLQSAPPGRPLGELELVPLLAQFGLMFSFALAIAAPVVIVLLLVDTVTRGHAPLLGTLLWMAAVALFFGTDGHHALLRAFALSLQSAPPGRPLGELELVPLLAQFGLMFSFALAIAA